MDPVRFAVIGCGVIGKTHVRLAAKNPQIDVVAVADVSETTARAVADEHGVKQVHTSAEAVFADASVEAVTLALPTGIRTPLALAALKAGKHVLVEKPAGMNTDEIRQMIAARGDRLVASCSSRMQFQESFRFARDFIAAGNLGTIRVVRVRAIVQGKPAGKKPPPVWRLNRKLNGGGIFVNWGTYDLDYMLALLGWKLRPRQILAQLWQTPDVFAHHAADGSDAETHIAAMIACDDGIAFTYERGEAVAAAGEQAWQITGDKGSLRLHMTTGQDKKIYFDRGDTQQGVVTETVWEGNDPHEPHHAGPMANMADAIRHGKPLATSIENALCIQRIFDGAYASALQNQPVTLD